MDQKDTEMNEKGLSSSTSGVVVQVREKKGPLRAAIPYMPFPVAVICLFLNTFVPGLGTFVSAFTVLCGARTDLPDRHVCCVFWLNIAAAFIQILTAIVMVGWIMSIFWGMDMVILASEYTFFTFQFALSCAVRAGFVSDAQDFLASFPQPS
ncbi:STUM protein, partial [Atractosteus spatula]|nr:STUM protein [Atractosteus spatula]